MADLRVSLSFTYDEVAHESFKNGSSHFVLLQLILLGKIIIIFIQLQQLMTNPIALICN